MLELRGRAQLIVVQPAQYLPDPALRQISVLVIRLSTKQTSALKMKYTKTYLSGNPLDQKVNQPVHPAPSLTAPVTIVSPRPQLGWDAEVQPPAVSSSTQINSVHAVSTRKCSCGKAFDDPHTLEAHFESVGLVPDPLNTVHYDTTNEGPMTLAELWAFLDSSSASA